MVIYYDYQVLGTVHGGMCSIFVSLAVDSFTPPSSQTLSLHHYGGNDMTRLGILQFHVVS